MGQLSRIKQCRWKCSPSLDGQRAYRGGSTFTDEELDLITNDDIQYRMGQEEKDEGERMNTVDGTLRPVPLGRNDSAYPAFLTRFLGNRAPDVLYAIGNVELLQPCSAVCGAAVSAAEQKAGQRPAPQDIIHASEPPLTLGSCILRSHPMARVVQEALLHFEGQRYQLHAWCIMPNHVHVVVTPLDAHPLSAILHSWKSFTAHQINKILGQNGSVWERESFDHLIRSPEDCERFIHYTERNPVDAGLCHRAVDWPFGSCGAGFQPATSREFVDPRRTPSMALRSRGELPHLHKEGGTYFVTFRLADAVLMRRRVTLASNIPYLKSEGPAGQRPAPQNNLARGWSLPQGTLGLFCSVKCPGSVILKTYDLAKALRDAAIPVIGGFHTPMEKECLDILLRGQQPIVICQARGLERIRPSPEVTRGIQAGRVLLISPFGPKHRRATTDLADQRNRLVASLATRVFVSHAAPGGKTEALCREIIAMGKPLFTVDSPENDDLMVLGAKGVTIENWTRFGA